MSYDSVTNDPRYRPENIRAVPYTDEIAKAAGLGLPTDVQRSVVLLDFDDCVLGLYRTYDDAQPHLRSRRGVVKAALTRQRNKDRAAR